MNSLPKARHGRPRGFIDWTPHKSTNLLIDSVRSVLAEYQAYLPLTIRQVFYRLVANAGFEKSERGYSRLCETLNRARRARIVAFDAIRDDGFHRTAFVGWQSAEQARAYLIRQSEQYQADRQRGQRARLIVWCEAQGMVPQLEAVAGRYSVPVYSSGGFDSVTVKHRVAEQFAAMGAVQVLHIGDHDPSGVHVFGSLDEDITAFLGELGGTAEFSRLAVTPEQIADYALPTAPPKASDRRAFIGETTQAEALPPNLLADILRNAITARINPDTFSRALDAEANERAELLAWIGGAA